MSSESTVVHDMHCQEPWFSSLRDGLKPVEGRQGSENHRALRSGDVIRFFCDSGSFHAKVTRIDEFPSLDAYLLGVGIKNALPGVETLEEARAVYLQWSTEEEIRRDGFLGIWVELVDQATL